MKCKDRVAIVTGASGRGMGRSIALTLAREGAKVVVNYRSSKPAAEQLVNHIEGRGGHAIAIEADVFQARDCKHLVNETNERFGRVDICIINPGAGWHPAPLSKLDASGAFDDMHQELAPIYNLMPLVLPQMYERKWGRVVTLGLTPPYGCPSYAYSVGKAARAHAILLAKNEAWANGVTLNLMSPGPVSGIASLEEAIEQCDHGAAWPSRKNISPQDIAEGVAFLCSESGRFVSGCELPFLFH